MAADQPGEGTSSGLPGAAPDDVILDTSAPPRSAQKVDLDLDDAPFLEEEEEIQPEPPKPAAPTSLEPEKPEKTEGKPGKKKLILIGVAALLLLVGLGVGAKLLFFSGKKAPAEAPKQEQAEHKPAPAENATEAKPEPPEIQVKLDPFWVEQKDEKEQIRFLIVRMNLGTQEQGAVKEVQTKLLPLRNAIFYYLKNKDVQFLADERNAEKMKAELLLVINQYIAIGKFDTLMFEEYVVK